LGGSPRPVAAVAVNGRDDHDDVQRADVGADLTTAVVRTAWTAFSSAGA
jgi:hypothetical protein